MQRLGALVHLVAVDAGSITEPDRRARLLSSLLGAFVLMLLVLTPIAFLAHDGRLDILDLRMSRLGLLGTVCFAADFGLSRSRYRSLAAPLFVALLFAFSFGMVVIAPGEPVMPAFLILATPACWCLR